MYAEALQCWHDLAAHVFCKLRTDGTSMARTAAYMNFAALPQMAIVFHVPCCCRIPARLRAFVFGLVSVASLMLGKQAAVAILARML
jgi:hypothetical protein